MVGNISRITIITAVFGRSEKLLSNLQAYNQAVSEFDERPVRMFVFSEHPRFTKAQFINLVNQCLDKKTPRDIYEIPPEGIYKALNFGVLNAKTEFLIFNHSDDCFMPNTFRHINNAEIDSCDVSSFGIVVNNNIVSPAVMSPFPYAYIGVNHSATIFRSSIHKKYEYNTKMKFSADWELIIRMHDDGVTFKSFPCVICIFSDGGASNSLSIRRLHEDVSILVNSLLRSKHIVICLVRIVKEVLGFLKRFFLFNLDRLYKYLIG